MLTAATAKFCLKLATAKFCLKHVSIFISSWKFITQNDSFKSMRAHPHACAPSLVYRLVLTIIYWIFRLLTLIYWILITSASLPTWIFNIDLTITWRQPQRERL
jgi:hypothetical protein